MRCARPHATRSLAAHIARGADPTAYKWTGQFFAGVGARAPGLTCAAALEGLRDGVFTFEGDVWSFGIVVWEILSLGERPYPQFKAFTTAFLDHLKAGKRMDAAKTWHRPLHDVAMMCTEADPGDRPSFAHLVALLRTMEGEVE